MAYRSQPPDPSEPVYHGSAFPWSVVETSGAVHVGTHDQATDMTPVKPPQDKSSGGPLILLRKGGSGSGRHSHDDTQRAFRAPPSAPNGGITELSFNPGVGFHDVDVGDRQANSAHLAHSREAGYPRGGSIDESAYDWEADRFDRNTTTPPGPGVSRTAGHTYEAAQALRENKVLRYANTMEGNGEGFSYVVPNPDLNLRQYGEAPKPVAGKSYHQTPLPGIDLAAVKNPGPFHEEFDDGGPDYVGFGDVRKPNMSRTLRRPAPQAAPQPSMVNERLF